MKPHKMNHIMWDNKSMMKTSIPHTKTLHHHHNIKQFELMFATCNYFESLTVIIFARQDLPLKMTQKK